MLASQPGTLGTYTDRLLDFQPYLPCLSSHLNKRCKLDAYDIQLAQGDSLCVRSDCRNGAGPLASGSGHLESTLYPLPRHFGGNKSPPHHPTCPKNGPEARPGKVIDDDVNSSVFTMNHRDSNHTYFLGTLPWDGFAAPAVPILMTRQNQGRTYYEVITAYAL